MKSSKKTVDVLGYCYEVVETSDKNMLPENSWGIVHHDKAIIYLYKDMSPQGKRFTLWHELMHCIEYRLSLEFDEETIDRLAAGVDYITKHNKV